MMEPQTRHSLTVRSMFSGIAARYDLLNRIMTLGQDRRWRRETIGKLELHPGDWLLDIGAGTGDLAVEALRQQPELRVVAADFTFAMVQIGRAQKNEPDILWVIADAQSLPFSNAVFDAAVSGFLLRNVTDIKQTLLEQARILVEGGRIATLDTTPPQEGFLKPLILFYFRWIIPLLGRWIAGDENAYRYLPESSQAFHPADQLAEIISGCDFTRTSYLRRMLGTIAIHWATKHLSTGVGMASSSRELRDA